MIQVEDLQVFLEDKLEYTSVQFQGKLTLENVESYRQKIEDAFESKDCLLYDLSRVLHLDSESMGFLIQSHKCSA